MATQKSTVEPISGDKVISRGVASLGPKDTLQSKFAAVLKRAPGLTSIKVTDPEGISTVYTGGEVDRIIKGEAPVATDNAAAAPKQKKERKAKATATSTKKPGVIDAIVGLLTGATGDGVSIAEMVAALVVQFPDRPADSMAITVRCQLGRLTAQRGIVITKTKVDKLTKYKGATPVATEAASA